MNFCVRRTNHRGVDGSNVHLHECLPPTFRACLTLVATLSALEDWWEIYRSTLGTGNCKGLLRGHSLGTAANMGRIGSHMGGDVPKSPETEVSCPPARQSIKH